MVDLGFKDSEPSPVLQTGQTFIITPGGEKNTKDTGWCLWGVSCSEETQMPQIPFLLCSSVCAFISHRGEGDKT